MPGKYKSEELRKLIVEAKQRGEHHQDIDDRYHVSVKTVYNIWNRWKAVNRAIRFFFEKPKKKSGRLRKTTPGQARLLLRQIKKDPSMTAVGVKRYAQDHLSLNISKNVHSRLF